MASAICSSSYGADHDVGDHQCLRQRCVIIFGAKFQRNIEELLVAPVPTHVIIAGYVGGGVARGLFVGILVTAISLFLCHFRCIRGYSLP